MELLITIAISILLPYTMLSDRFSNHSADATIAITDTAQKNSKSGGTDVRITRMRIDDEDLPLEKLEKSSAWRYEDSIWMAVNPDSPETMTYHVENAKRVEIYFQKHDGSGIAEVSINGKRAGRIDLYSPTWKDLEFRHNIGAVSIQKHIALFVLVVFLVAGSVHMFPYAWNEWKKRDDRVRWGGTVLAFYAVLWFGSLYFDQNIYAMECCVWTGIMLTGGIGTSEYLREKDCRIGKYEKMANGFWLLVLSYSIFFAAELVGSNVENISGIYMLGNMGIYFLMVLILYMITRTVTGSFLFPAILSYIFAVANYFVNSFRGTPITPGDFLAAGTAKNVFLNYRYEFQWEMFAALWFLIFCFVITWYLYGFQREGKREMRVWILPFALLATAIIGGPFFKPQLDLWNLNYNVEQYGIAMSFVSNVRSMHLEKPEGYSSGDSESEYAEFIEAPGADQGFHPNVIAIMNESFSDLSVISSKLNNEDYLSYFNSLQDNFVKGHMLVYPIGGGTANTEYEFLTGNSMEFLQGTIPYQQFINKNGTYSIAQILKARGYHTIGIHPYDKSGYGRYRVYPRLGFDEFLDLQDFDNPELVRERYASDKASYEKVIEEFEKNQSSGKPVFIFNVTMQNHSGYDTGYFKDNAVRVPGYEGKFPNAEEYLTLIKESDQDLSVLLDYFRSVKEPTVIVFFGDHQPMVETEFYETLVGKPLSEWTLAEAQKRYIVPFFIWANYDIEAQNDMFISANYLSELMFEKAGMDLVPYQDFLKEVRAEIPAMNGNGYLDREGNWHEPSEKNPLLQEYWRLQYRNMFDKKIHY
ncbi:LTA synthase family protein [Brotaphodocola sp.]|uniref:LTA synthase family protein n=1 Tax=Brotaphodocola sp. TaxID=3073577 RepID=UPI003D7C57D5